MTAGKPPFSKNDRTISAAFLNEVAAKVRERFTAGDGITMKRTPSGGMHFSLSDFSKSRLPRQCTVLIVEEPDGPTLKVRKVRYPTPPRECEGTGDNEECAYEFASEIFFAYPDFGWKAEDYSDLVHDGETIGSDAPFLKAYWEDLTWRVEKPAEGGGDTEGDWVVVRSVVGVNALRVQRVKVNDDGLYVPDGTDNEEVLPQLGFDARLYQDFTRFAAIGSTAMVLLPMLKIKGAWHVLLTIPMQPLQPSTGTLAGACVIS